MADDPEEKEAPVKALDEDDIALLKTYGLGPYATRIKAREKDLQDVAKRVNEVSGLKESDSGLAPPSRWDLASDKQAMQEEQPLQVLQKPHGKGPPQFGWQPSGMTPRRRPACRSKHPREIEIQSTAGLRPVISMQYRRLSRPGCSRTPGPAGVYEAAQR